MTVSKVQVGIVGLGLVSYSHIQAYLTHQSAVVVAVCDLNSEQAGAVAKKFGIETIYSSYEDLLHDPNVNTVDIATPTFLHAQMAIQAIQAGKNVMCEKPFCLTLSEGMNVCESAKENGVTLMVGESYVFTSSIMKARALIDAGEIGKPLQIRERFAAWHEREGAMEKRTVSTDRGWRLDTAKAGGNGYPWMFDHCVHFFSTAEYLMNDTPLSEIYSLLSDNSWMSVSDLWKEDRTKMNLYSTSAAYDIPIITWKYKDPACQGIWMRAEYLNGKYDPMSGFFVSVIGSKGMIEVLGEGGAGLQWQGKNVHLILHRKSKATMTFRFDEGGDDIWESDISYYSQSHINQIHYFVDCLIQGIPVRYDGNAGVRAVRATMSAICSAKENRPITISDMTDQHFSKK